MTLQGIFKYERIPYSQLTDPSKKDLIDNAILKIQEAGLETEVLNYVNSRTEKMDISLEVGGSALAGTLPSDMLNKIAAEIL